MFLKSGEERNFPKLICKKKHTIKNAFYCTRRLPVTFHGVKRELWSSGDSIIYAVVPQTSELGETVGHQEDVWFYSNSALVRSSSSTVSHVTRPVNKIAMVIIVTKKISCKKTPWDIYPMTLRKRQKNKMFDACNPIKTISNTTTPNFCLHSRTKHDLRVYFLWTLS